MSDLLVDPKAVPHLVGILQILIAVELEDKECTPAMEEHAGAVNTAAMTGSFLDEFEESLVTEWYAVNSLTPCATMWYGASVNILLARSI